MASPSRSKRLRDHLDGFVAVAFLSVILVLFYNVIAQDPNPRRTWLREDNFIENAQAAFFLAASIGFLLTAWNSKLLRESGQLWRYGATLLWAGLMFFFFGEEISWGQRLLNIAQPETGLLATNLQSELNLHNMPGFSRYKSDFVNGFILFFGIVLPVLASFPPTKNAVRAAAFPVAPLPYLPLFLAALLLHAYLIFPRAEYGYAPREYSELLFALGMALFALHGAWRPDSLYRVT